MKVFLAIVFLTGLKAYNLSGQTPLSTNAHSQNTINIVPNGPQGNIITNTEALHPTVVDSAFNILNAKPATNPPPVKHVSQNKLSTNAKEKTILEDKTSNK